jgi:menaquinone-dependent protoporphyrinogen oxidase
MASALVVFASRHGSTQEVAAAVAEELRAQELTVRLTTARSVPRRLDRPDLVVLGAPLYSGRWSRDAHRFLKRHRDDLIDVPVAVFAMGPRTDTAESWQRARHQLDRALARRGWLRPVAAAVFGGADPPGKQPRRDLRDWPAIRAWADSVAAPYRTRSVG